jgi:hypothetical protein
MNAAALLEKVKKKLLMQLHWGDIGVGEFGFCGHQLAKRVSTSP